MLDVVDEPGWEALLILVKRQEWSRDLRFADPPSRVANDADLAGMLEVAFGAASAYTWETKARELGVPLVSAADSTFEEFIVSEGLVSSAEHPAFGTYWRLAPRIRFADARSEVAEACALGEHSVALLGEFGYTAQEIDRFTAEGVVVATATMGHRTATV
jgi:crotonobetainyl-CoA:carnitine CoA-transferase CaiB-like acyl-CoA transferase